MLEFRVGNRLVTKLRGGGSLVVSLGLETEVDASVLPHLVAEIRQILGDLGLTNEIRVEVDC